MRDRAIIAVLLFLVVNPVWRLLLSSFEKTDSGELTLANYVIAYGNQPPAHRRNSPSARRATEMGKAPSAGRARPAVSLPTMSRVYGC